MSRKVARELAFKAIFEECFQNEEEMSSIVSKLIEIPEEENYELTEEDNNYINEITNGVKTKKEELDEKIKGHLKGWTMERLSRIDIAILRLAIYEITYRNDIPYKVTINEAVELAKIFGEDASPSFINGVLAEIIK